MKFAKRMSAVMMFGFFAIFFVACAGCGAMLSRKTNDCTYGPLFDELWSMAGQHYYHEISDTCEAKSACYLKTMHGGITTCLDPHSAYLPPVDYVELEATTRGTIEGVGLELEDRDGHTFVVAPIDGGSAVESGQFQAGDMIVKVNDANVSDKNTQEVALLIRGPANSSVVVTVMRNGVELAPVTLKRREIKLQSVFAKDIGDDIVYIRVSSFQNETDQDFNLALKNHIDRDFSKKLIIDLRNNPGGLLDVSLAMACMFGNLLTDHTVTLKSRGYVNEQTVAHIEPRVRLFGSSCGRYYRTQVTILVNKGSASASEVFTGIMKDWGRATVIGTRTYGKGTVQTIFPLSHRDAFRVTTAEYFVGPHEVKINGVGITPDIVAVEPERDKPNKQQQHKSDIHVEDNVPLKKTIEIFKNQKGQ